MTGLPFLPPKITKEVRALLPVWAGSAALVVLGGAMGTRRGSTVGLLAYAMGALVLGAQSVGHEYSHRTLGGLLSQPCDRRRLYTIKLGVLALMLLTLGALAWSALRAGPEAMRQSAGGGVAGYDVSALWVTALCGLCLAPVLTKACRSALAGAVFTAAVPAAVLLIGDLIGLALRGARLRNHRRTASGWLCSGP